MVGKATQGKQASVFGMLHGRQYVDLEFPLNTSDGDSDQQSASTRAQVRQTPDRHSCRPETSMHTRYTRMVLELECLCSQTYSFSSGITGIFMLDWWAMLKAGCVP